MMSLMILESGCAKNTNLMIDTLCSREVGLPIRLHENTYNNLDLKEIKQIDNVNRAWKIHCIKK